MKQKQIMCNLFVNAGPMEAMAIMADSRKSIPPASPSDTISYPGAWYMGHHYLRVARIVFVIVLIEEPQCFQLEELHWLQTRFLRKARDGVHVASIHFLAFIQMHKLACSFVCLSDANGGAAAPPPLQHLIADADVGLVSKTMHEADAGAI